jgi:hypothetical protein
MPSGGEETSANDLDAYWLGFDDKANMDVLSKALRFLLNLRACYR